MPGAVLFRVVKGFIYGNVLGFFMGLAFYLFANYVNTATSLPQPPGFFFGIIWAGSILAGVGFEYGGWLDELIAKAKGLRKAH